MHSNLSCDFSIRCIIFPNASLIRTKTFINFSNADLISFKIRVVVPTPFLIKYLNCTTDNPVFRISIACSSVNVSTTSITSCLFSEYLFLLISEFLGLSRAVLAILYRGGGTVLHLSNVCIYRINPYLSNTSIRVLLYSHQCQ